MKPEQFEQLGKELMLAAHNKSASYLNQAEAEQAELQENGEVYKRELCKIASAILDGAGESGEQVHNLYSMLADKPTWHNSFNTFTDAVEQALSKEARLTTFDKSASPLAGIAASLGGSGAIPALAIAAAAAGAGTGAVSHWLSKDTKQTSADNEAIKNKIRAYKRMTRDIKEDLALSGALDTEDTADDQAVIDKYEL